MCGNIFLSKCILNDWLYKWPTNTYWQGLQLRRDTQKIVHIIKLCAQNLSSNAIVGSIWSQPNWENVYGERESLLWPLTTLTSQLWCGLHVLKWTPILSGWSYEWPTHILIAKVRSLKRTSTYSTCYGTSMWSNYRHHSSSIINTIEDVYECDRLHRKITCDFGCLQLAYLNYVVWYLTN